MAERSKEAKAGSVLTSKWAVGFHDRGLGHGDFGVIVEQTDEVVVPKISKEMAEHIVEAHNKLIKRHLKPEPKPVDYGMRDPNE